MINKKLIHFNTYSAFEANKSQLYDWTIAFIGETKQIYTHGNFYDCNIDDINSLQDAIDAINEALGQLSESKQDVISDLDVIRNGAELGATALQSVPSEYVTESELTAKGYTTNTGTVTSVTAGTGLTGGTITGEGTLSLEEVFTGNKTYYVINPPLPNVIAGSTLDLNKTSSSYQVYRNTITYDKYGRFVSSNQNSTPLTTMYSYTVNGATTTKAGFMTAADKIKVDASVQSDGTILNIVKVSSLPSSPDANTLYVIV